MKLGEISAHFESGSNKRSVGTISYNKSDPGGKSYGKFQIAIRPGTLKKYLAWSVFNQEFKEVNPGTEEFDAVWKRLAEEKPAEFEEDQFQFIKVTHYDPVARLAKEFGFDTEDRAIQEALFSIGVQHGRYAVIIKRAARLRSSGSTDDIDNLYEARKEYVQGLVLPANIKASLMNRYYNESLMVHLYSQNTQYEIESLLKEFPQKHQTTADNTK